jgi:chemotaxis protein methyltransferase CheR
MAVRPPGQNNDNEMFQLLLQYIQKELNFNCHDYNEAYIRRRLNARMLTNNLPQDDFATYMKALKTIPEEPKKLYDALTINVTQFFRDTRAWDILESDVFPKVISEKKNHFNKTLSIWSCGCSSGEEPYSLAIMMKELIKGREVIPKIIATDIDDLSLKRARAGIYPEAAFKTTPPDYLDKYFHRSKDAKGNEKFEVDASLKSIVQIFCMNAITQMPPGNNFDMIFCRNVIIYFTQETKNKLMEKFYDALRENGWLVIGKSEVLFTAKVQNKFYVHNGAESIYRKERRASEGR